MREAIKEARKSFGLDDVPVGAVVVKDKKIIARGHNQKEVHNDATDHAEIIALKKASQVLGNWYLEDCDVFTTLEPCLMCFGAMLNTRARDVYYGARDLRFGTFSANELDKTYKYNHKMNMYGGILEDECSSLLSEFFKQKREGK